MKKGFCIDEDSILILLAIAQRRELQQTVIPAIGRAAKHWRSGDKALAAIHLAQIGLRKIDEEDGESLRLAAGLLDAGMSPRELARELGLNIQFRARKYEDSQPRVPAGNCRASGQWTSGDSGGGAAPVVEGRSGSISDAMTVVEGGPEPKRLEIVEELPKDAIIVTRPDGIAVDDPQSPTGKLMAPPRANFQEVYAAGTRVGNLLQINAAVGHYGKFDFQRDGVTNTFYTSYKHASNYAVGVFMAGAGYSLDRTISISETFASHYSSNYIKDKFERKYWTSRGWDDAHCGAWK